MIILKQMIINTLLLSIYLYCVSCSSTEPPKNQPWFGVDIDFVTTSGNIGVAPYLLYYDFEGYNISSINKIEIDFGDGAGYEDVTDACIAWWKSEGEQPFHVYNDSGTYSISTRLKLTSNAPLLENNVVTVFVFPPDESEGE